MARDPLRLCLISSLLALAFTAPAHATGTTADGVTVTHTPDVSFWSFDDQGLNVGKYGPVLFVEPDGP